MITIHKIESESITEGEGYVTVEMRGLSNWAALSAAGWTTGY